MIMIYLLGLLALLFVFVSIIPFIQLCISMRSMKEEIQYKFPQELLNSDMDNLKYERKDDMYVPRISIQNRGSVRLAKGNILTLETLENRKVKANSVELP